LEERLTGLKEIKSKIKGNPAVRRGGRCGRYNHFPLKLSDIVSRMNLRPFQSDHDEDDAPSFISDPHSLARSKSFSTHSISTQKSSVVHDIGDRGVKEQAATPKWHRACGHGNQLFNIYPE